jgi:hypothetical protein
VSELDRTARIGVVIGHGTKESRVLDENNLCQSIISLVSIIDRFQLAILLGIAVMTAQLRLTSG